MDEESSDTERNEAGDQKPAADSSRSGRPVYDLGRRRFVMDEARLLQIARSLTEPILRSSGLRQMLQQRKMMEAALGSFRYMDRIAPSTLKALELSTTASIARTFTGSSLLAVERIARVADFNLSTKKWLEDIAKPRYLDQLFDTSKFITSISESLISAHRLYEPVVQALEKTMLGWRDMTRLAVPRDISAERLFAAGLATRDATLAVEVILEPDEEVEVPAGWTDGPTQVREQLRARLAAIDPKVLTKWDGAWERLWAPGPDAASQAAGSVVELIDWTLRRAAPDKVVLRWHSDGKRPVHELDDKGRPTRGLRIKYLMASRNPRLVKAASHLSEGTIALLAEMQGGKHGLEFDDLEAVKFTLYAVEGALGLIFL